MDPEIHQRYLDYLELRGYFSRPERPKLDASTFGRLHVELEALLAREREGEIDAGGVRRISELRAVLLRD